MTKHFPSLSAALLLAVSAALGAPAQTPRGKMQIGPVHMTFGDNNKVVNNTLYLNDVVMTSKDYDLQAASVVADMTPAAMTGGKTPPPKQSRRVPFSKIVAYGDPAKGTQVTGRFASEELARSYFVQGDKAVYVAEPGRLDGGRIDFTGHVLVTLKSPQALDGPAVTQLEHATVLVGPKPDYPQVEFGAGRLDFTPLQ